MRVELDISRIVDDGSDRRGALVYHNHELWRVEGRTRSKKGAFRVKYRRIGKINLDREMRLAELRLLQQSLPEAAR